jgi:hypothetical protein
MTFPLRHRKVIIINLLAMTQSTIPPRQLTQQNPQTRFPGLDDQHAPLAVCGETVCKDTAGCPAAEDEDVPFLRLEGRFLGGEGVVGGHGVDVEGDVVGCLGFGGHVRGDATYCTYYHMYLSSYK